MLDGRVQQCADDDASPAPPQEAMFPSLKLNDDLSKSFKPSNDRDWTPEQAVLADAEIKGEPGDGPQHPRLPLAKSHRFHLAYYDKTFDLDKLTSVDFIVVPFNETPSLGHTMLSFAFDDKDYLAVSVEIRKERGEAFNPMKGFFQQYEIMYVVASERDVIQRRVELRSVGRVLVPFHGHAGTGPRAVPGRRCGG